MRPNAPARLGDRQLFDALRWRVYLNHAGIAAASAPVVAAARAIVEDYARRGSAAFFDWLGQRERLRDKVAALIGAQRDDVAFVQSTTRGLVDIAMCFPWRRGDRVVLYEGEFPANVTPWQRAAELFGLTTVMLPLADFAEGDDAGLARLDAELARGIRVVAVSAVEFQTGLRMPLATMAARCHAAGAELCVDAVQACGAVERGYESLRAKQPERRSCILGVLPPGARTDPRRVVSLQRVLAARGIACSIPDGVLRFAPHWPNALDEVPIVLAAVDEA